MTVLRPAWLFDREAEWADLDRFLAGPAGRLGVMWGSRRVGKSFLLGALCDAAGGLFVQAVRQDSALFLTSLGRRLAEQVGAPAPLRLDDWSAAVRALLDLPQTPLVVLDEFPYLVEGAAELPTVVQAAVDERRPGRSRLLLCGSAISQMAKLLAGDGPLYRRAAVSLRMRPFDLRTAIRYWGLEGRPTDALTVHAVVGGTPGYRDVLGPVGDDVETWIIERALDPSTATFHEDELVFAADPSLPDANVYRSILAAVVAGERTPTGIARATGRKATSLGRSLDRLVDAGLLVRTADPLRAKRSLLDIADPFLRFHYAIIRPNRAALSRRRAAAVWDRAAVTFRSQVAGPHFEHVCREAVLDFDLGLPPIADVGATMVYDPALRRHHEVDVVGIDEKGLVTLIGEVKASTGDRTLEDLRRLEHVRSLLPADRRAAAVHLAVFTAGGADANLRRAASQRDDVSVIDAAALCG
ncbi:MAG: AAA family ATPase [Egibacteraceae bacterium]